MQEPKFFEQLRDGQCAGLRRGCTSPSLLQNDVTTNAYGLFDDSLRACLPLLGF